MSLEVISDVQAELKSHFTEMGLADEQGKPLDEGSIVVEGQGEAPSPLTKIANTHTKSKRSSKRKSKKARASRPSDSVIYLKQQVVEQLNEQIKEGVHLNHVPLPEESDEEYSRSASEEEDEEEGEETHSEGTSSLQPHPTPQDEGALSENKESVRQISNQKSDRKSREEAVRQRQETISKESLTVKTTPTVFSMVYQFLTLVHVVPVVVRCLFNTIFLFTVSWLFNLYARIVAQIQKFQSKFDKYTFPTFIVNVIQYFWKRLNQFNGHVINFLSSKLQENEKFIQQVESEIEAHTRDFRRDYRKIEDTTRNYSFTVKINPNLNVVFVILARTFLTISVPVFNYVQSIRRDFISKSNNAFFFP